MYIVQIREVVTMFISVNKWNEKHLDDFILEIVTGSYLSYFQWAL